MRALLFLELRYARGTIAAAVRSPFRLTMWLLFGAFLSILTVSRLTGPGRRGVSPSEFSHPSATAIGGLYLGALGLTAALVAGGRITIFRNTAEAVLFSNAGIRPLTIAIWLQLRKLAASCTRWLGMLAYAFVAFEPYAADRTKTLLAFAATLLALAVQLTIELPVFLLSRGPLNGLLRIAGWTLAAIGFVYALAGALDTPLRSELIARVRFDPGSAVLAVQRGHPVAILILATVVAFFVGAIALLGDDTLPELYAASQRRLEATRRRRSRGPEPQYAMPHPPRRSRVAPGAFAMLWKDWIGFKRGRGTLRLWTVGAVAWTACGAGAAYAARHFDDPAPLVVLAAVTTIGLLGSAPLAASLALAEDLAKPLFWLSRAPLRARIAAWTFGRTWRSGIVLGLAPVAAGIVSSDVRLVLLSLPLAFAACWSLQALGVGLYALFPNPIDARGPLLLVRLGMTVAFIFPPALAGAAVILVNAGMPLACGAAGAVLAAQGWAVVELAALRFEERGAALGTLSRTT